MKVYCINFCFVLLFFLDGYAFVHKSEGHICIEKAAYKLLKNQPETDNLPSGKIIYNYLVAHHILKDDDEAYSAFPDLGLGRQFLSDRQIYHFMANSKYVRQAVKLYPKNVVAQKRYVVKKALPECLLMTYTLFREVVDDNVKANKSGRGIYVLIHAIVDSYSREHTIRNSQNFKLETIKSWRLSELYWPKATKIDDTEIPGLAKTKVFLHTRGTGADGEWEDATGKLTPLANQAAIAVKEVLVAIYLAHKNKVLSDNITSEYIANHFTPINAKIKDNCIVLNEDNFTIKLSYNKGYRDKYNSNVMAIDRYPRYLQQLRYQQDIESAKLSSFGYEFTKYISPRAAFSVNHSTIASFLKRLPYGFALAINENTSALPDTNFLETLQFQGLFKTMVYLPYNDVIMEGKIGYGVIPFYSENTYHSFVGGVDFRFKLGKDFKVINKVPRALNFSIGYEYDSSNFRPKNSVVFKIGYNTWQARVFKD
ncbi:hypothetical protein N9V96_03000 [Polaribacter sp.]|nr:hypothetical protein [Polaribacter sp.]